MESPGADLYRMEVKPVIADPRQWVLDVIDGTRHIRMYVGNGEITERGDVSYSNGELVGYPITISFYPDESGNLLVKMSDDDAWAPITGS